MSACFLAVNAQCYVLNDAMPRTLCPGVVGLLSGISFDMRAHLIRFEEGAKHAGGLVPEDHQFISPVLQHCSRRTGIYKASCLGDKP